MESCSTHSVAEWACLEDWFLSVTSVGFLGVFLPASCKLCDLENDESVAWDKDLLCLDQQTSEERRHVSSDLMKVCSFKTGLPYWYAIIQPTWHGKFG